jgi:radical SAM protein (TIGR04043 family)
LPGLDGSSKVCPGVPQRRLRLCGIHISLKNGATIPKKNPEQLGEVAEAAVMLDGVKHVTLTSGAFEKIREELDFLASCCRAIKERAIIPVHIQCMPPVEEGAFARLRAAGVDTVGIHIESFDRGALRRTAPGKAAIGLSRYLRAWKEAVEVFGKNQVSSFLIVGLGESRTSILEGAEMLSTLGVYPFIVPLRPIPGTPLGSESPPSPGEMASIYEAVSPLLFTHGVSSSLSKAGCVRCAACSALPDFERQQ